VTEPSFRPNDILGALVDHGVKFVLIGGLGARLRGSSSITNDVDICYARTTDNLRRLASALRDLGARLRGAPEDVPFLLDAATLKAGDHFTFTTPAGSLDLLGTPAGVSGHDQLDRNAETMHIRAMPIRVASIDDLIRMKLAAGRPDDLIEVEVLGALREELEGRGEP
jgi:hypothetical protein